MKNIIALVVGVSMIFALGACGQKVDTTVSQSNNPVVVETKVDEIKKAGKLVIGTSAAYPPYEFHKEIDGKDTIIGFDIDIAQAIADDLGVELEIVDMQFSGLLAALNAEKVDIIIAGMTPTEERKQSVDFSQVYYQATQAVVIRADQADVIKTVENLKKVIVGVQKGTTQEEIAKNLLGEGQLKPLGKVSDVMLQVLYGKIDAVIVESPVANSYVSQNPTLAVSSIQLETGDSGSAIAIKKGNEELVEVVNETLDHLMKDGKIEEFIIKAIEQAEN